MKVIGLIGGMSWNSTLEYYRIINEGISDKLGGLHSAHMVVYSLDFEQIELAQREARWDDAADILVNAATALKRAGADILVICTNTMHKVADLVVERTGLPLVHIGDAVSNAIKQHGICKIGLLGTRFVMEEQFYQDRMEKCFGIEVLVPGEEERAIVHRIIYEELCRGRIEDVSREACVEIIRGLVGRGAQGIVLGCTELPLLIRPVDVDIPVFNTTRLHAEAAVRLALAE